MCVCVYIYIYIAKGMPIAGPLSTDRRRHPHAGQRRAARAPRLVLLIVLLLLLIALLIPFECYS